MNRTPADIVVVGAGPTGLALGAELRRLGVEALVLDRLAAGENTSRAAVVHARTLEVLEPLGVTEELLRNGVIVPTFRIRDRSRILATISFRDLKTAYPFALMCPQDRTEAVLLRRLESLGGAVQRPAEVIDVFPGENEVAVQCQNGDGAETIQAKWVVGCDGAHSVVRERASIPFEGGEYEESFVLADLEMDWPLGREEVSLFYSDEGLMVVAPLPDDQFRVVATAHNASAEPEVEDFKSILGERGPEDGGVLIRRMVWSSRFHIQHRVAKALRRGRILLAGDAAHVHSPAGGQGLNIGIQDAVSLARALQRAAPGEEETLNQWQEERLKAARSVVSMTDTLTKIATASNPGLKLLRNVALELIGSIPFATHAIAETLAELRAG